MNPSRFCSLLTVTAALLTACNAPTTGAPTGAVDSPELHTQGKAKGKGHKHFQSTTPAQPRGRNLQKLPDFRGPPIPKPPPSSPGTFRSQALTGTANPNVFALRMLVVTAGAGDPNLETARTLLGQAGVPFDVLDATAAVLTEGALMNADGSGRYQGVILTNNALLYEANGQWQSALDVPEWQLLWEYERLYGARQLALYTYPGTWPEDYGLRPVDGSASDTADLRTTAAGGAVFRDLRPGATVPVRHAWNYPATVTAAEGVAGTQPLLTDAGGRVLAATSATTDGRERLALTFAHNPFLLHSQLLNLALLDWVTRGLYVGEYRRYNQLDIDDWFLPNDRYDPATGQIAPDSFRISAQDALSLRNQQTALQTGYDVATTFRFAIAYNGGGANTAAPLSCDPAAPSPDPLSSMSRCLAGSFDWFNHTRDHLYMDFLSRDESYVQVNSNKSIGVKLGLVRSTRSLVTGDMSGLGYYNPDGEGVKTDFGLQASNMNFLLASQDAGVQFLASNHSVSSQWDPSCHNCGMDHPLNPTIFLVPRWPTNIFYYATDPAEIAASYNAVYGPGGTRPYWDHNLSYAEVLDKESDLALSHVLAGGAYPHYMHQSNLREYTPGRSVASDWERALLDKYTRYSTLPLKTLRWDDLGVYMKRRTVFMKANVRAVVNRAARRVSITSPAGGAVYVTGLTAGQSVEQYGGRPISSWNFSPNQTRTFNLP
ncbi:hypothetical protein [Deinococcus planocerae]|uniref:Agd3-related carbohydrate-binding protein n=1 Tax=Deinococcus planocerae TaxID=1737569 RepID=UPI000C7EB667|nr:hypothetical protein [Deinococcus planocerae]